MNSGVNIRQSLQSLLKGFILLCKMEPHQMPDILLEKTGARNRCNAHLFRQINAELFIILIAEFADIHQDIICPLRSGKVQPDLLQAP